MRGMCGIHPGRRVMLSRSLASRVVFCNSRCNGSSSHSEEQAVLPSTRELQQCFFSAFRFCKREHHGSWAIFCAKGRQFKSVVIETYTCNNTIHDPYLLGKDFRLLTRYSCATYFGKVIGPAPSRGPRASCIQRILGAASVFRKGKRLVDQAALGAVQPELWTRQAADTHPPKRRYTAMQTTLSRPWSEERPPSLDFSGTSWF